MADDTATAILGDSSYFKDPPSTEDLSNYVNELISTCDGTLQQWRLGTESHKCDQYINCLDGLIHETLLVAEKRCRLACDGISNSRVCKYIILKLFETGDLDKTCKYITILCKKRNQSKRCIIEIVTMSMNWIYGDDVQLDNKYKLIEVLCNVTAGKVICVLN